MKKLWWLPLALAVVLFVQPVEAAGGVKYISKSLGFSLVYPRSWHVSAPTSSLERHVLFYSQGKRVYAFDAGWLTKVKAGSSISGTLSKFITYEKSLKNMLYERAKWTATSLGGKAAKFTVTTSVTEGGVVPSTGTIITGSRGHIYLITFTTNQKKAIKHLSGFPTPYLNILASWHWL